MRAILAFLILLVAAAAACPPAAAEVRWLATDYDFGTWREVEGKRTGHVRFVNLGPDTVVITRVRPSCGCTAADYTSEPVLPGDTATVGFTYDPAHRPGRFEKTVRVIYGPGGQTKVITIRGSVIGTPASLARRYPLSAGGMRLSAGSYSFGQVEAGGNRHGFITGYNQTPDTLRPVLRGSTDVPGFEARLSRKGIGPGEMFTVTFYLSARQLAAEPGLHEWNLEVCAPDSAGTPLCIPVRVDADLRPALGATDSASLAVAPRVSLPSAPLTLSTPSRPGAHVPFSFDIANTGASPLKVLRVYCRAGAVKITKAPRSIKPGARAAVKGYVDLSQVEGPAYGFIIDIVTNDPLAPETTLRISGQTPSAAR